MLGFLKTVIKSWPIIYWPTLVLICDHNGALFCINYVLMSYIGQHYNLIKIVLSQFSFVATAMEAVNNSFLVQPGKMILKQENIFDSLLLLPARRRDPQRVHRGRHVCHPGPQEDRHGEGLPGGCQQGHQVLRQVQRHPQIHDLQLSLLPLPGMWKRRRRRGEPSREKLCFCCRLFSLKK